MAAERGLILEKICSYISLVRVIVWVLQKKSETDLSRQEAQVESFVSYTTPSVSNKIEKASNKRKRQHPLSNQLANFTTLSKNLMPP